MEEEAIFIYCLADSIVKSARIKEDPQCLMTHAEIITFVMISALYYRCNYAMTRKVIALEFGHFKSLSNRLKSRRSQINLCPRRPCP